MSLPLEFYEKNWYIIKFMDLKKIRKAEKQEAREETG